MKKKLVLLFFALQVSAFLTAQVIDKIHLFNNLNYRIFLESNTFFLSNDSNINHNNKQFYIPIDDKDSTTSYYKWTLRDSMLIVLFNDIHRIGQNPIGRIKKMIKAASNDSFKIQNRSFAPSNPYSLFYHYYRYIEPDSTKYIKYEIGLSPTNDLFLGVTYPREKVLSIWKYLTDSTYERAPNDLGLYGNRLNWSFVDSIRLDSIEDFCMMKTPGGFLLSFTDGQSFILQNGNKTDHRTLPKSAKFLFIQEENRCAIKSVDANGNTVASTVYTW